MYVQSLLPLSNRWREGQVDELPTPALILLCRLIVRFHPSRQEGGPEGWLRTGNVTKKNFFKKKKKKKRSANAGNLRTGKYHIRHPEWYSA